MTSEQKYVAPEVLGLLYPVPEDHADLPYPVNGPYFIMLKDGPHMVKATHWGQALVPVNEIPSLPEYRGRSILWYPDNKLPTSIIAQAWSFFAAVFKDIQSEAMVYITQKNGEYRLFIPPQKVTKVAVKVKNFDAGNVGDWQIVGTIHSHCDFSAHHSTTDVGDADNMDGLHITIGHVNTKVPSMAIMISVNKQKWDLKPEQIFSNDRPAEPESHPSWWHRYVEKESYGVQSTGGWVGNSWDKDKPKGGSQKGAVPPQQAPVNPRSQRTSGSANGHDRGKPKGATARKGKGVKWDDDLRDTFDDLSQYAIWDGFTGAELERAARALYDKWDDLSGDLLAIGIWAEIATTPSWNILPENMYNVQDIHFEMESLIWLTTPTDKKNEDTAALDREAMEALAQFQASKHADIQTLFGES